jgi:hypothetical protein
MNTLSATCSKFIPGMLGSAGIPLGNPFDDLGADAVSVCCDVLEDVGFAVFVDTVAELFSF